MKALVLGFGSIGKRHVEILSSLSSISTVGIITRQELQGDYQTYKQLDNIDNISTYDYFIIASETAKHYEHLSHLCKKVSEKKILVEKPLYDKSKKKLQCNNQVFTAYNLRFHPVLQKIIELIEDEKIYFVNAICGQYLPTWRPDQDYKKSYSADLKRGGGVLRDLSHELDYLTWLFGKMNNLEAINTKVSDLEIKSDDIFTAIALTDKNIIINVTIDYISKTAIRRLIIHTKNNTIEADFIKNEIAIHNKTGQTKLIEIDKQDRNYTYEEMHKLIINDDFNIPCTLTEGEEIVTLIDSIQFRELR